MEDLFDIIDVELSNHPDCYSSSSYAVWERSVAEPALKELGYENIRWSDGERDSFGPLTRVCTCKKDNSLHQFIYG